MNNELKNNYIEQIVTIGDLRETDKVMGTDGKWHDIELLPIYIPDRMFRINFKDPLTDKFKGYVECSDTHEWNIFFTDSSGKLNTYTANTLEMFNSLYSENISPNPLIDYKHVIIGANNIGYQILNIEEITPKECRCIKVKDTKDYLFEIILNK